MKNIDIEAIQKRRLENYEREKDNLIVVKIPNGNGYEVSNINKATVYKVLKDPSSGLVTCTCKDYYNYRQFNINCKHKLAVSKKASKINTPATKSGDNIIKEELSMNNNNANNNNINKFNPQNHLMKVKGKDYLEVKYRVHWFRQEKPDWDIQTKIIQVDLEKGIAIAQADIFDSEGRHRSSGIQMEEKRTFQDYLAKAETASIGRALANLGYGTLQCFDLEEGRIVDSPVSIEASPKTTADPATTPIGTKAPVPNTTGRSGNNTAPTTAPTVSTTPMNKPSTSAPAQPAIGNKKGGNGKTDAQIQNIIKRW